MLQIAAERQSSKMASNLTVHTKQSWVIEFLHAKKLHPLTLSTLAEYLRRANSGCEHSGSVYGKGELPSLVQTLTSA